MNVSIFELTAACSPKPITTCCSVLPPEIVMRDNTYISGHSVNNIKCVVHDDLWWKNQTTRYILPHHWLYEWFSRFYSCGTYSVLSRSPSVKTHFTTVLLIALPPVGSRIWQQLILIAISVTVKSWAPASAFVNYQVYIFIMCGLMFVRRQWRNGIEKVISWELRWVAMGTNLCMNRWEWV